MLLVGGQRLLTPKSDFEETLSFYGDLFSRLTREVSHIGPLARYVGYQSPRPDGSCLHFLGIEVDQTAGIGQIPPIPPGMVAWELTPASWRVFTSESVIREQPIAWQWHVLTPSPIGEFSAPCPVTSDGNHPFYVTANAYVHPAKAAAASAETTASIEDASTMESAVSEVSSDAPAPDDVEICNYDPSWPSQFDAFALWLRSKLGPECASWRIEHFGSTAIPGMPAKPVIDVLLEVPSFSEAKPRFLPLLNSPEWEYWWYDNHMMFVKRDPRTWRRTHHLHLARPTDPFWERLAFRDYLIENKDVAAEYAQLKRSLAAAHPHDRERYTQSKSHFVRETTDKALATRRNTNRHD